MNAIPDTVLARLCSRQAETIVIFALSCIGLVVTVLSILFIDLNPSTRIIAYLNVPGLIFLIALTGSILYLCRDDLPSGPGA